MLPAAEKVCAHPEKEQGSILRNSVTFWETADAEENLSFSSRQKSVRPRTQTHIKKSRALMGQKGSYRSKSCRLWLAGHVFSNCEGTSGAQHCYCPKCERPCDTEYHESHSPTVTVDRG